jgi:glycosyl transferase family 2
LHERSSWRRFISVYRNFGLGVALKVTISKVRGVLLPASAMPDAPTCDGPQRELSIFIDAAGHDVATLQVIIEALARRKQSNWEMCICAHPPLRPDIGRVLSRFRDKYPWIRIVSTDQAVDKSTAAQWTVEQATGEFVALLAPQHTFDADAATELLARLQRDPQIAAAMLLETDSGSVGPSKPPRWDDCRLLLQRKSQYLAAAPQEWPLTAPALAKALDEVGARTAIVARSAT